MKAAKVAKTGISFDKVIAIIRKAIPRFREYECKGLRQVVQDHQAT